MLANEADITESDQDTALGWIARFRSDSVTEGDRQAFALWLAESPAHKHAMDSMLDMWADLASVRQLYPDSLQIQSRAANQGNWWRVSIAAAACLVVALLIWPQNQQAVESSMRYQTALGEQQTIELEDGSTLTLNTNSRVSVSFDEKHRQLELIRGEAFFKVAKDPGRPFDVNAGSARVTAIGTAFNIYRTEHSSDITVVEGVVRVTELGDTGSRAPATEILRANQQLTATDKGLQAAAPANVSQQTAWQRGELIANNMTLAELIAQIERYHDTHILLTDASIATLKISGVFDLSDLSPILQALQVSLGVKAVPIDSKTLQLIKTPDTI